MWSRLLSRSLVLGAVATLAGITYYFLSQFQSIRDREHVIATLQEFSDEAGPCAALIAAHKVGPVSDDMRHTINGLRQSFAIQVVGETDKPGRKVLLDAEAEGILDQSTCEQIKLAREVGETHPVFALLRYTRYGGRVCEEEPRLGEILASLGSHRSVMLHAIMKDVHELRCLSPSLAEKIASMTVETLFDSPRALDDLDVLRIAGFLDEWAPERAAQLGCRVEAKGEASRLGTALGCTPDHRRRVLTHYKTLRALARTDGGAPLPAGTQVVLVREQDNRCEVIPFEGDTQLYSGTCTDLTLVSDLFLAVRIEAITYGRAAADLVAGLATYVGERGKLQATTKEPELRSWFGYDASGELLGPAHIVELRAVAAMLGEEVPERPLRAFCQRSGARYCYDVDWAHAVSRLSGEAVVFLSRPESGVFLQPMDPASETAQQHFRGAFGRLPSEGATIRVLPLAKGGELISEASLGSLELRWRLTGSAPWQAQSFGSAEGGAAPPSARLLAALDLQQDGRPELIMQRVTREMTPIGVKDTTDEVVLLHLGEGQNRFSFLNRLTVHEY
jgi:hypothetical protein